MNDNEIVKALECCMGMIEGECEECPMCNKEYCKDALMGYSRNLINRLQADQEALINGQESLQKYIADLQAEIERLQGVIDSFTDIGKLYSEIKSEARKEFAERLCEGRVSNDPVVIAVKVELEMMDGKENGDEIQKETCCD